MASVKAAVRRWVQSRDDRQQDRGMLSLSDADNAAGLQAPLERVFLSKSPSMLHLSVCNHGDLLNYLVQVDPCLHASTKATP